MNTMTNVSVDSADGTVSDLVVAIQYAAEDLESEEPPSPRQLNKWARAAYAAHLVAGPEKFDEQPVRDREITIRMVDRDEMIDLNHQFRDQQKVTNVLSFPAQLPLGLMLEMETDLLGDIVICHSVVIQEALHQKIDFMDHYAHMVVHGVLHLCGYDHQHDDEAAEMEGLEAHILKAAGIANPYH